MKKLSIFDDLDWISYGFYDAQESLKVSDAICMKQLHFSDALWIDKAPSEWTMSDALITKTSGLKLTIRTADCGPILLADTKEHIVAAIHAGWKSALQGLIENTINVMKEHGSNPDNIRAAIGPHLQLKSFEVSEEMIHLFPPIHQHFFIEENNKCFFDFNTYLTMRLNHAGIYQIQSEGTDTYSDPAYNSYRRDPKNPQRQFSIIEIKET